MTISIIGAAQSAAAIDGGNVTLTFNVAPVQDDIVIVVGGHFTRAATNYGPSTAGYNLVVLAQPTNASLGLWWKAMGASPDSTVVCQGSGNAADACAYACIVLRGVDKVTPINNVAPSGSAGSTNPDPASLTPSFKDDLILAAALSIVNDTTPGTQTNYTQQATAAATDTNAATVALSSRQLAAISAEDPPAWSTWSTGAWTALTISVRTAVTYLPSMQPDMSWLLRKADMVGY